MAGDSALLTTPVMQAKESSSTPTRRSARSSEDRGKRNGGAGHAREARRSPTGRAEAAAPPQREGRKAPRRPVDGNVLNELVLLFIRHKDAMSAQGEAAQAARCGMTRQRLHQAHTQLKVVTLPLLCQWCGGRGYRASEVLRVLEDYLDSGGSIEHARKCQGCLP